MPSPKRDKKRKKRPWEDFIFEVTERPSMIKVSLDRDGYKGCRWIYRAKAEETVILDDEGREFRTRPTANRIKDIKHELYLDYLNYQIEQGNIELAEE